MTVKVRKEMRLRKEKRLLNLRDHHLPELRGKKQKKRVSEMSGKLRINSLRETCLLS